MRTPGLCTDRKKAAIVRHITSLLQTQWSKRQFFAALCTALRFVRARFFVRRYIVAVADRDASLPEDTVVLSPELTVRQVDTWDVLTEVERQALTQDRRGVYFDARSLVASQDATLWLVFWNDDIAGAAITYKRCPHPYYVEVPADAALIGDCAILPRYRKRGILHRVLRFLAFTLLRSGSQAVYGHCQDWNVASDLAIKRSGMRELCRVWAHRYDGAPFHTVNCPGASRCH